MKLKNSKNSKNMVSKEFCKVGLTFYFWLQQEKKFSLRECKSKSLRENLKLRLKESLKDTLFTLLEKGKKSGIFPYSRKAPPPSKKWE